MMIPPETVNQVGVQDDAKSQEIARLKAEAVRSWDNARQREEERDQARAALSAMTTERNAILKAANEHTGSCFAERDQLKTTITDLVEALGSVLEGLGNPRTVHIGYACQRYEVTYPGLSEDNPIERARKALARAKESK